MLPERRSASFWKKRCLDSRSKNRVVVMLRDIDDLSTAETVAALDLTEENLKVRLHRGRAMARNWLLSRVGAAAKDTLPFVGVRCDGGSGVFARLGTESDVVP